MSLWKRMLAIFAVFGVVLAFAACGDDDDGETSSGDTDDTEDTGDTEDTEDAGDDDATAGEGGNINLGIIPSWTDGLSMAYLWQAILEEQGYSVDITEVAEAAPLYTAVAGGDVDVYPSAWPDVTHSDYMTEYGDDLENLGAYYDGAVLTMAVPEYTDIDSIEDLTGNADQFDGRIVGIEPGAGLTRITEEEVMPTYDLEGDYELVKSSTVAMLSELETAVDNEEDIVVTLWRPYWANSSYPVKDLEDPEGALGEPETLAAIATAGFSEEFPEVAEMMGNASLNDEQYGELENLVVNEYGEGNEAEAVQEWIDSHQDWVDGLSG